MTTSGTHHHHVHAPNRFIHEVEATCERRGLRLTPLRRRVLELIAADERPVKAYDLLDRLRQETGKSAPPTIYRALDFLLEHGFIHKLESINSYTGCHHPSERHSPPFFICKQCGHATEFCNSEVAELVLRHAHELGFAAQEQTLEVHGICARCRRG
jgi:Fur family transcriptional regulator, zinc uptake regulator